MGQAVSFSYQLIYLHGITMKMSTERERRGPGDWEASHWRIVVRGLDLTIAGLAVIACLPVMALLEWSAKLDMRWWLVSVAIAALPDAAGRCLCLSAPIARKIPIVLSIACQLLAFGALAALVYCGSQVELAFELVVAACFQAGAAVCFTLFLHRAARSLGRQDLVLRADALGWMLFTNFLITAAAAAVACLLLATLLAITVLTDGYGYQMIGPTIRIAFAGLGAVVGGLLLVMYWNYGSTLAHLRRAIQQKIAALPPCIASDR